MKSVNPPVLLVKHSLAPASSVADVMTKKYADQKAKYRRENRQNIILPVLEEYFCWLDTLTWKKAASLRMRCGIPRTRVDS